MQKLAFLTFIVCLGLPVYVIIAGAAAGVIFTAFVIVCVKVKIKRRSKSRNLQYNDKLIDAAPINKRPRSKESDVIEVDVCLPNTSHFIGPGVNREDRTVTSSHGSQMTPRNEAYDGATVLPCTTQVNELLSKLNPGMSVSDTSFIVMNEAAEDEVTIVIQPEENTGFCLEKSPAYLKSGSDDCARIESCPMRSISFPDNSQEMIKGGKEEYAYVVQSFGDLQPMPQTSRQLTTSSQEEPVCNQRPLMSLDDNTCYMTTDGDHTVVIEDNEAYGTSLTPHVSGQNRKSFSEGNIDGTDEVVLRRSDDPFATVLVLPEQNGALFLDESPAYLTTQKHEQLLSQNEHDSSTEQLRGPFIKDACRIRDEPHSRRDPSAVVMDDSSSYGAVLTETSFEPNAAYGTVTDSNGVHKEGSSPTTQRYQECGNFGTDDGPSSSDPRVALENNPSYLDAGRRRTTTVEENDVYAYDSVAFSDASVQNGTLDVSNMAGTGSTDVTRSEDSHAILVFTQRGDPVYMDESPAYSATMIPDALESNEAYGVAEYSAENND